MTNLSKREKMLLGVLLVVGIGYLYYTLFLNPMLDKIVTSDQTIKKYDAQLQEIKDILATNEKFKKDYDMIMEKYNLYSEKIPYSYRDPEIAYDINILAERSFSEITSIKLDYNTQQTNEEDKIIPIPVSVDLVAASYENIIKFVHLIETDTRIAQIKSLSLTSNTDTNSESTTLNATIGLEYYYVKDNNENAEEYDFNNGAYGKSDLFK